MADSNTHRLQRIESKLTRMMLAAGLDAEGNPDGAVSLTRQQFDDVVSVLDSYLQFMDDHDCKDDARYNEAVAIYNDAVSIRNARWKTNPNS